MPKNVVLCCDGTANEFAENNTNVVKLYSTLIHDPARQVAFYHPGLGTMEPAGALTTWARATTKLLGKAIGYGLENDIRDAYVFLMQTYEPRDSVYLFGFSRGAYTARAVACLLKLYGLIHKGNESLVPYAIRMMMGITRVDAKNQTDKALADQYFNLAGQFRNIMSGDCKPHFVGLWDTVSSVGWIGKPLHLPYISNNPDVQVSRHAISIDERRAFFRTNLWQRPDADLLIDPDKAWGPQDVKQVWFPGVHCDVGGGYPEAESGLSKHALHWMIRHAEINGLLVDQTKVDEVLGKRSGDHVRPDANAIAHESLKGFGWNLAELIPKKHYVKPGQYAWRMNRWQSRFIPPEALVHESAFARKDYRSHFPPDAKMDKTP